MVQKGYLHRRDNQSHKPGSPLAIESLVEESIFVRVSSQSQSSGAKLTLSRDRATDPTVDPLSVFNNDTVGHISFEAFTNDNRIALASIKRVLPQQDDNLNDLSLGGKLVFSTSQVNTSYTKEPINFRQ